MEQADLTSVLFPGDYVCEPAGLPGLKLVSVASKTLPGTEYAIVRFYQGGGGSTTMRPILRTYDCIDAKRQFRRLRRALWTRRLDTAPAAA
jgi:hypothetical protein